MKGEPIQVFSKSQRLLSSHRCANPTRCSSHTNLNFFSELTQSAMAMMLCLFHLFRLKFAIQ
ncbi:hypothetical protein AC629_36945 [Bradyrhizobium sp. NAS80.1]|nr:hypothetical protein AC629_36945 [Bradyrhizobium sp. NAS80.1]OKO80503.1 hypothetical protein AC630_15620 [Bradyrhizobium sp. AS23.2]